MKIEKINDYQIKCILTKEDLTTRHINVSELAYGSEKAKSLFRDMMQIASMEYGFTVDDIPIMIEAIPNTGDSILLIITKVEYPEELDTRFSNFSPFKDELFDEFSDDEDDYYNDAIFPPDVPAQNPGLFQRQVDDLVTTPATSDDKNFIPLDKAVADGFPKLKDLERKAAEAQAKAAVIDIRKLFTFHNLSDIISLSRVVKGFYNGVNSLYKSESQGRYYLVLSKSSHSGKDFDKVCNILSEYGSNETFTSPAEAFFSEHYSPILRGNALQTLSKL